jgi:hypothetical protein
MKSARSNLTPSIVDPSIPDWLIDDYIESYIEWREESESARRAYQLWRQSGPPDCSLAFAAYGEALDREERAAQALAQRTDDVCRRLACKATSGRSPGDALARRPV